MSDAQTEAQAAQPEAVDPAATVATTVTHESLLGELMGVVKRDCRGISRDLEGLIEKAAKHFGL
jgi:hypothetical protein